jgi:hypothetical protein
MQGLKRKLFYNDASNRPKSPQVGIGFKASYKDKKTKYEV